MTIISWSVEIMADSDAVYNLICRVEDFSIYSNLIDSIKETAARTYHWKAKLGLYHVFISFIKRSKPAHQTLLAKDKILV